MYTSPRKIFLIGMMGSGKSYWAHRLEQYFAVPALDLDDLVEKQEGLTVAQIFDQKGEDYFRQKERDLLRSAQLPEGYILACGGGTPCFYDNMAFMRQRGLVVWLDLPIDLLAKRVIHERGKRPLVSHHTDMASMVQRLTAMREERLPHYAQASLIVTDALISAEALEEAIDECFKKEIIRKSEAGYDK